MVLQCVGNPGEKAADGAMGLWPGGLRLSSGSSLVGVLVKDYDVHPWLSLRLAPREPHFTATGMGSHHAYACAQRFTLRIGHATTELMHTGPGHPSALESPGPGVCTATGRWALCTA